MRQFTEIGATGLLVLGAMVVSGCGSPFDQARYGDWPAHDPASWRTTERGSLHSRETLRSRLTGDQPHTATPPIQPPADADADDYVKIALAQNPAIRAAQRRVERLGERVAQVTSLDDPMFQVAPVGDMAETAAGQVGLMTGVSQKLPFPGKLETRGRIAGQDTAMALADLQQTRLQVIDETRRAFWNYYFTTRAIETTRDSRALLVQFKHIAETDYKTGTRSQSDVLRASVELSNLDNELIVYAQRQATARAMLNQLMDRPVDASLPLPAKHQPEQIIAKLDDLLRQAAVSNPSIRKIHERIEQFRQRRKLARLNRWPDLTVSANYNAVDETGLSPVANGQDQWWFGFGVNLPIWVNKYDAAEREALKGMLEGVADLTAQHNRVAFDVQDASLKVEAQRKLVELFSEVIVPQAQQTVDASASGYRAGRVDFLTLVDNWRKLLNFDLMYHRALTDMEQATADLERAVGRAVARRPSAQTPDAPAPPPPPATPSPPAASDQEPTP